MSVIETLHLTKSYGSRRGVADVNLSVEPGEIFGFLGPNGAGKSTTIRMLTGFLRASSGHARVFGQDCWTNSDVIKREVGYVAGDVRLYPWLTTNRAFRIVSEIRGKDIEPRGRQLAERFRLECDLPVRKMSRGNRQKVALVLALAHDPKLVILDEPTSGLDPLMQDTLAECLREMAEAGNTVFFSSHTLNEVETLCDRVAIVRNGAIVVDDKIQNLKAVAPRTVTLTFESEENAANIDWPDFVELKRRYKTQCNLEIEGSAMELTKWANTQSITDITISPPSLDALFRGYYETQKELV
ncbi:MAG: ABC transporter ATP-binding protein [Planctomycetaceae bacterium]